MSTYDAISGLTAVEGMANGAPESDRAFYLFILQLRDQLLGQKANANTSQQYHTPVVTQHHSNARTSTHAASYQELSTSHTVASVHDSAAPLVSAIEPVALEKSADHSRSERALKRKRIDYELVEAYENSQSSTRQEQSTDVPVDVSELYDKLNHAVPHVSGFKSVDNGGNESVDENSYYSSRGNSWSLRSNHNEDADGEESDAMVMSSEEEASDVEFEPEIHAPLEQAPQQTMYQQAPPQQIVPQQVLPRHTPVPQNPQLLQASRQQNLPEHVVSHTIDHEVYEPFIDDDLYDPEPAVEQTKADTPPVVDEYSPPAQELEYQYPTNPESSQTQFLQALSRALHSQSVSFPHAISLNHIQSPAAPQPAHISPFATANLQAAVDRSNDISSRSEVDQSALNTPTTRKRKKHKNQETGIQAAKSKKRKNLLQIDSRKARSHGARVLQSPEIHIKEEPISPQLGAFEMAPPTHRSTHSNSQLMQIPKGYKLVPVEDHEDGEEDEDQFTPSTYQAPRITSGHPTPKPVYVDANGKEFFAQPPPKSYNQPPTPRFPLEPTPQRVAPSMPQYFFDREPMPSLEQSQANSRYWTNARASSAAPIRQVEEVQYPPQQQAMFDRELMAPPQQPQPINRYWSDGRAASAAPINHNLLQREGVQYMAMYQTQNGYVQVPPIPQYGYSVSATPSYQLAEPYRSTSTLPVPTSYNPEYSTFSQYGEGRVDDRGVIPSQRPRY
jgi:hypothetical protein